MKSHLLANTASYPVLLWAFFALSCSKAEINNDERYIGRLVAGDCPSYGIVEVENANIGSNWRFQAPPTQTSSELRISPILSREATASTFMSTCRLIQWTAKQ